MEDHSSRREVQLLLDDKIRELQRERNQLSPVSTLPSEVLGYVFLQASLSSAQPSIRFNFSFVSHHWREVALSTPDLWSILPGSYIDWCRVMLKRSKTTDLRIAMSIQVLEYQFDEGDHLVEVETVQVCFLKEVFAEHTNRIKDLVLHSNYEENHRQILKILPPSTPRLRNLCLVFKPAAFHVELPKHTFADATLSGLELQGCMIHWNSHLLQGLNTLRLFNTTIAITQAFQATSMSDFLNALRAMPRLEVLHLGGCIPSSSDGRGPSEKAVTFPSLQQLIVANRLGSQVLRDLANLLQSLVIPFLAKVDFDCRPSNRQDDIPDQWTLFSRSLGTFFTSMIPHNIEGTPSYDTFCLRIGSSSVDIRVEAWREPWAGTKLTSRPPPHFALKISSTLYLAKVVTQLPLSRLRTLSLFLSSKPSTNFLTESFGYLPQLDTIIVNAKPKEEDDRAQILHDFIDALGNHTEPSGSNKPPPLPFPSLKYLHMEEVHFTRSKQSSTFIVSDALIDCLRARHEHESSLWKLTLTKCPGLLKKELRSLRTIVAEVEWE